MRDKILFVDDEPSSLDRYALMLGRDFEIDTAISGEQGLKAIHDHGPYAVVVSDMRMPRMSGAQFLSRAREAAPDSVRLMLTGLSDINAAMEAVNQGNVFRLLPKSCNQNVLAEAITSGLNQYRLITAEKFLLENTLMGSIKVLTDILGAVNPEVFGKSIRITRCVRHLVAKFHIPSWWCFEAAAMLSQLGCLMLDPELIQAAYVEASLSAENRARFESHPIVAKELLVNIPRMEPVAWMISQQLVRGTPQAPPRISGVSAEALTLGARMIKVAVAFDNLRTRGVADDEALTRLRYRSEFDRELIDALSDLKSVESQMELRTVAISTLRVGMVLQQDIKNRAGVLVVAKGQEVTHPLLIRLEHFSHAGLIDKEILASIPV
jgi:response regulator RpfG family c-di-GMP phosphodiesterase